MTNRNGNDDRNQAREDRLRAALRANLQRRKAQSRARAATVTDEPDADEPTGSDTGKDDS